MAAVVVVIKCGHADCEADDGDLQCGTVLLRAQAQALFLAGNVSVNPASSHMFLLLTAFMPPCVIDNCLRFMPGPHNHIAVL